MTCARVGCTWQEYQARERGSIAGGGRSTGGDLAAPAAGGSLKPSSNRPAARRERTGEGGGVRRDPPTCGSVFAHHEEPSKPCRPPSAPARDLARQPRLPVERDEGSLDVRDHRLHLDDEQRRRRRVEREDVNRAAFASDRERDLGRDLPAEGCEPPHDRLHERGVRLVQQSVERLAVPEQPAVEPCAECIDERAEHPDRQPICPASFDAGDGRPGDARVPREVDLSPPASPPQCPNRESEPNCIHRGEGCAGPLHPDSSGKSRRRRCSPRARVREPAVPARRASAACEGPRARRASPPPRRRRADPIRFGSGPASPGSTRYTPRSWPTRRHRPSSVPAR